MNLTLKNEIIREYRGRFPAKKFIPGVSKVPVSGKIFDYKEMILMSEAVLDGWWTEGRLTKEFEGSLANYVGVKFCTTVNSGSSANLIALFCLTSHLLGKKRIKAGDEVVTLAASFPTTINPIIQAGCVPVFIDVKLETLSVDISLLEKAVSKKTRAVMIANTLGNPNNLHAIKKLCKKHDLWFIEDNCDSLGSIYAGKKTGSFGDISTLSFYPAHQITCGEGGAVLTDNALLNKIIRSFRDWGRDCWCPTGHDNTCGLRFKWKLGDLPVGYDHKYIYSHIGFNLKMTEMQAACGIVQLKKLPSFIKIRRSNYKTLLKSFKKLDKYFSVVKREKDSEPNWFGFPINIKKDAPFSREELLVYLNEGKIATRLLFGGNITKQPYFKNYPINYRIAGVLNNSDTVMSNTFWIGVYPGISKAMIKYIVKIFSEFIEKYD